MKAKDVVYEGLCHGECGESTEPYTGRSGKYVILDRIKKCEIEKQFKKKFSKFLIAQTFYCIFLESPKGS
jgi:hypothetical protein